MFSKTLLALPAVMAAGWNYETGQGQDWFDDNVDDCTKGSQSPIDLKTDMKKYLGGEDMWMTTYDWPDTTRRLFGHETFKYSANPDTDPANLGGDQPLDGRAAGTAAPRQFMTSGYMMDMGTTGEFDVAQFHVHHPGEHTVDGEPCDVEIHWVHYGKGALDGTMDGEYAIATAAGIMFKIGASVSTEVDAAANDFLEWIVADLAADPTHPYDSGTGKFGEAPGGDKSGVSTVMNALLHAVDWNNRWSYSGSLTTPPCWIQIQHNVLKTALPITQAQIDAIKTATTAQEGKSDFYTATKGNYRMIMPLKDEADAVIVTSGNAEEEAGKFKSLFIAFLVLFIITLLALCIACYMYASASAKTTEPAERKESEMANQK